MEVQMQAAKMHHEKGSAWGIFFMSFHLECIIICVDLSQHQPSDHPLECISIPESYKGYSGLADTKPLAFRI